VDTINAMSVAIHAPFHADLYPVISAGSHTMLSGKPDAHR
jgi:hypothetical protein